jgi:hypothetical protein
MHTCETVEGPRSRENNTRMTVLKTEIKKQKTLLKRCTVTTCANPCGRLRERSKVLEHLPHYKRVHYVESHQRAIFPSDETEQWGNNSTVNPKGYFSRKSATTGRDRASYTLFLSTEETAFH